jgi:hypothetical protein
MKKYCKKRKDKQDSPLTGSANPQIFPPLQGEDEEGDGVEGGRIF